jgi:hypothetical protein
MTSGSRTISDAGRRSRNFRSTNNRETEELSDRPASFQGGFSAQRMVMAAIIGRVSGHEGICRADSGRGEEFYLGRVPFSPLVLLGELLLIFKRQQLWES